MVFSLKKHFAIERRPLEWCISQYPAREELAKTLVYRINHFFPLDKNSRVLEVGAAQGLLTCAFYRLGFKCEGIEPLEESFEASKKVFAELGVPLKLKKAAAESIPFDDNSFDLVVTNSVMEHVDDVEKSFAEISRVLKPKGAFYFYTASSMCPQQNEIRFFPFFGWYPDGLKRRIMDWAVKNRPSLVGYTTTPAINWFTPWKAKRLLNEAGFKKIYTRWDLLAAKRGKMNDPRSKLVRIIASKNYLKILADICKSGCSYLAIKE